MSPIHLLTAPGDVTASTVACGARDAALASWDARQVTCPACGHGSRGARQRQAPARFPSEKAFQEAVRGLAWAHGWLYYHVHDSRHSPRGFPDTVCVRRDPSGAGAILVCAELKMPGNTPSAAQQAWLTALGQVTEVRTFVWTPADWESIDDILS